MRDLALEVLLVIAALQPLAAVVFVLDGVLIGAGDAGYLAVAMLVATLGAYLPAALAVALTGAGLLWLWGTLSLWMLARGAGVFLRYRHDRWAVTGAATPG